MRLGDGWLNVEPGRDQLLKIVKVDESDKYEKVKVTFKDERGGTCTEQFMFERNGKVNEVALNIFTTIAMCAMDDTSLRNKDFDPEELVGRYVVADVVATEYTNPNTGKTGIYNNLKNFRVARDIDPDAVEDEPAEEEAESDDDDDEGLFD